MAYFVPPEKYGESEMEEGEIVDDLSDISSGEEFLMRERLELLEMYNNVLERKKAKNPSYVPGKIKEDRIQTSKDNIVVCRKFKHDNSYKPQHKPKKKKMVEAYSSTKVKDYKKKTHRRKKLEVKIISESSDESDDEYRNKRRKLADAVVHKGKQYIDRSSLQDRLQPMLGNKNEHKHNTTSQNKEFDLESPAKAESIISSSTEMLKSNTPNSAVDVNMELPKVNTSANSMKLHLIVDLCSDDDEGKDVLEFDSTSQDSSGIALNMIETQDKKSDVDKGKNVTEINGKSQVFCSSVNTTETQHKKSDDDKGKDLIEVDERSRDLCVAVDTTETKDSKSEDGKGKDVTEVDERSQDFCIVVDTTETEDNKSDDEGKDVTKSNGISPDNKCTSVDEIDPQCKQTNCDKDKDVIDGRSQVSTFTAIDKTETQEKILHDDEDEVDKTSQDSTIIAVDKTETQDKKATSESDEDLELLRQHALKSKAAKNTTEQNNTQDTKHADSEESKQQLIEAHKSEDEDSDTAELRQICLKSAILKKAIEMKKKQKLRKKLSQSSIIQDHDSFDEYRELESRLQSDNNTDRESVDMDIGSDADEKTKEVSNDSNKVEAHMNNEHQEISVNVTQKPILKDDELEEDEDLLRAKLLTSLSKNLPNLVDPNMIETIEKVEKVKENTLPVSKLKLPETRLVINVSESDSEGEHEATKNLTKMHAKLSEQVDLDFQQKLELLLKSKRTEVETRELPDVVQKHAPKLTEKYVPKTVNHLPRSEQMEYKYLVKRMAELQKIKEARQHSMTTVKQAFIGKDTLKPRNVSVNTLSSNKLEEQIALSRKKLAEESSRMLQLREEATKLIQKYKIVSTELKNISTAINLNKKEQRNSQNRLSKIRLEHNRLSSLSKHSKSNGNLITSLVSLPPNKQQKENHPGHEEYKNSDMLKCVKVSVVNDRVEEAITAPAHFSIQLDTTSNKKTIIMPATEMHNSAEIFLSEVNNSLQRHVEILPENFKNSTANPTLMKQGIGDENEVEPDSKGERRIQFNPIQPSSNNDYESPLQALDSANWAADPNAIMCPFEVGGNCKDSDCKYLHPKLPSETQ